MNAAPIRAQLKVGIAMPAVFFSLLIVSGLFVGGLAVLVLAGPPGLIVGPVLMALAVFVGYIVSGTNLYVDLVGDTVREQRLFTGRVITRAVADVRRIVPLVSGLVGATDAIMTAVLGTTNRGYVIRFRSGSQVALVRGDYSGIDELLVALRAQLGHRWPEVTAEPGGAPPVAVVPVAVREPRQMGQLVGRSCVRCQGRISSELDSRFCRQCYSPVHDRCARPAAGTGCRECGADEAAT